MTNDDLKIRVQASSGEPGVSPVAFLAVVEVIDQEGERRYVVVQSDGLSPSRQAALLSCLAGTNGKVGT